VGATIYAMAALLLVGKLLTNGLPKEGVGQVALLLLVAEFLGLCCSMGLPAALPKLLAAAGPAQRRDTLHSLLGFQFKLAAALSVFCLLVILFRPAWPLWMSNAVGIKGPFLTLLPPLVVTIALRDFMLAAAAGYGHYPRRAAAIMTISSLHVAQFSALYLFHPGNPAYFAAAYGVSAFGGVVVLLAGHFPRPEKGAIQERHESGCHRDDSGITDTFRALQFSAPLYVNNLMNFFFQRVDTLLVVAWLGLGPAAVFEMVKRIPGLLSRLLGAALVPYLPGLAERLRAGENGRASTLIEEAAALSAFVGYGTALLAIAIGEPLLGLLFAPEYKDGAAALGPLLIAACVAVQAGIMGQALIALDRPRTVMYINVGLAVVSLSLNLFLIPRYGISGAGWSAVLAASFSYLMQRIAVTRLGIRGRFSRGDFIHVSFVVTFVLGLVLSPAWGTRLGIAGLFVGLCLWSGALPIAKLRPGGAP
jgi:O-antigen/teichoic acid export membrane protein